MRRYAALLLLIGLAIQGGLVAGGAVLCSTTGTIAMDGGCGCCEPGEARMPATVAEFLAGEAGCGCCEQEATPPCPEKEEECCRFVEGGDPFLTPSRTELPDAAKSYSSVVALPPWRSPVVSAVVTGFPVRAQAPPEPTGPPPRARLLASCRLLI